MTDREAIKILEGFYHSEKAEKYGDVPQARGLAISALQERIDREKGCEYCRRKCFDRVGIDNHGVYLSSGSSWPPESEKFRLCPMCGKPLMEDAE